MLVEALLFLIVLVILVALAVCIVVLPLVALARTRHIGELVQRVDDLERTVRRLRVGNAVPEPIAKSPAAQPESIAKTPESPHEEIPVVTPARRPRPAVPEVNLEAWIGGRALGWIAVVLLIFAAAFFLRHVFEHGLIGPLGRVGIGLLIGLSLCGGGLRYHRRGWRIFGQFLTSGGIVLLYLSTFASFGYYSLLPREHAALFLIAIIAEAALLAIYYEAPAIAIMAVIGGLLTPPLMRTDHDQYQSLFTYLALLNVGVVALAWYRPWPAVSSVALAGTQLLFWAWYWQHFHPEKRVAALTFQAVVFGLFLVHSAATHIWRRRSADIEDLVRLLVNAFLFAVAFFVLVNPDYNEWRGPLALALAVVYTLLALQISIRRPDDGRQLFVTVALAMALIATAFAWQASAVWIAVGWAVQGLMLWWFGLRIRADALRMLGVAFLALAAGRLVLIDTPGAHPQPFVPLLNKYGVPATAVAAALIMAAIASRRFLGGAREMDVLALRGLGLCGVGLLWFVLSFEAFEYFEAQSRELDRTANLDRRLLDDPERDRIYRQLDEQQTTLRRSAQTALSVLWAIYAVVMLTVGFRMQSRPLRWFALGLFGLTLLKVGFIDTAELRGLYRVAAFLALSLMMGLGAWGYQKVRHALVVAEHKETDHATS